jgi:hypothetical protein
LDDDPWLEYEFRLARSLGMTVARLREDMGAGEFLLWSRYDAREDQRRQVAEGGAG